MSARLDKAVGKIERMSQQASSANRQIRELDRSGSLLNNTVGKLAAAFTIKELVSNITKVRGEFQQLEVSFQTMLGSAEKADTLMQQWYIRPRPLLSAWRMSRRVPSSFLPTGLERRK